jgi:hypothetical protein
MPSADAPPVLAQIVQRYAETNRGVVVFHLHRILDVHDAIAGRREDLALNGVYDDGVLARVHVTAYTIDGKPASEADIAGVEDSWIHPKPGDAFSPPFDERNLASYQYRTDGTAAIDFATSVQDQGHGNGSFTFDEQNDVLSYTYQPNVLPPHAKWGRITDQRAEVLPGYWTSTQETQEYKGTVGPFAGSGTVAMTYSGFRRFPDLQSALDAL